MEELQSATKLTNAKKVTQPPVESTINQRPRRKIKHKFIKCNRDSPEKTINADTSIDTESNVDDIATVDGRIELEDSSDATTSQATKPKIRNSQKFSAKKNVRLIGRQNRSKDNGSDVDESSLQMVEIIDDPSDDPNVSIEEIIETCVLDAEEYQRMVSCSKQISNDSSSNASSNGSAADKPNFNAQCIQNSCERQISVGLVDCMKNKDMMKHLALSERKTDDTIKNHTFEGVFHSKSSEAVPEKVDIKPTTEFSAPIRTRRVTRLSSMSVHRPPPMKVSASKPPVLKIKIEAMQLDSAKMPEAQNETMLEDATIKTESSVDISVSKCNNEVAILPTSANLQESEISHDLRNDELLKTDEDHKESINVFVGDVVEVKVETLGSNDSAAEIKLEHPQSETETDDLKSKSTAAEPAKISQESGCNDSLPTDEKSKEKSKSKKERKRTSLMQDGSQPMGEERTPSAKSQSVPEIQSQEQNKSDFINFMEKKFQDSDPSKQMQRSIADDSDDSAPKPETVGDIVKIEKNKKKKDSHADRDSKSKRTSDSGRKSEKSFDLQSTHKSSSSKSSSSSDKRSKDSKDASKSAEPKVKHHSTEPDAQTKKSHKRDNSCNRSEKEIAMDQLRAIEQKVANRNKLSSHAHKDSSEKLRDSSTKSKVKSTPESGKLKSKAKEITPSDQKDDKSSSTKMLSDQGPVNRKSQQQSTPASRPSKSNRSGTDFILSECYLPKQVKYDESLYSIEALKAAQAAQEEQIKADAEATKKAKEILAAKEEQAKAARTAARLAKMEEAKALEKAKADAEKAAKLAKAAAKAARAKQLKESKSNGKLKL